MDAGEYADAAASFEDVLDINDSAGETSDLKAIAGVFLCLSRAKNNQFQEARTACNGILQMRDAPQQVKDQASKLLTKPN